MKSDVIHKRSRHEVRGTTGSSSSPTPPARWQWHSPYDPLNGVGSSYGFGNSLQGGHCIGVGQDGGVDPSLGGMTFSPGATYTETLYPGPLSLHY
ncbi:hypothetical protein FRC02_003999 [Tulasnella sp. 418]|nr:hypothetical protein FRC02_003999 [Tulasnella sp. 418]